MAHDKGLSSGNAGISMTSKDRVLAALKCKQPDMVPVALGMADYFYEVNGWNFYGNVPYREGPFPDGNEIGDMIINVYERFKTDWIDVGWRASRISAKENRWVKKNNKLFHIYEPVGKPEQRQVWEMQESGGRILREGISDGAAKKVTIDDLKTKDDADEFVNRHYAQSSDEMFEAGLMDHVIKIIGKYGEQAFVCPEVSSFLGYFNSFEEILIAIKERPDFVKYFIEKLAEKWLAVEVKAYAKAGCHGIVSNAGSSYFGGCGYISPADYENIFFPIQKMVYAEMKNMGLMPILLYWGDVSQNLDYIPELGASGLISEPYNQGKRFDIREIKKAIGNKICVFGNIYSYDVLHHGTPEEIEKAVKYQLGAAKDGGFIMRNDVACLGTPPKNIELMVESTRRWGKYPIIFS